MRSRPCGKRRHEDFRRWSVVAERGMGPDGVVVAPPAFDDDLGFGQASSIGSSRSQSAMCEWSVIAITHAATSGRSA